MPENTESHLTKFNPSGSDSSKDTAISTQVIEAYREPYLSAELEQEFALASSEELLVMQRLLAREILGFLAFLLLSMAAILFTFDRIFQWSHTDNIRTAVIPVSAFTYAIFMLIWTQRTLVSAGSLLKIEDQLERNSLQPGGPKHRRFLGRFKADGSDPPLEYLMMFMFSFLLTSSSMVAAYIAVNSSRFRARLAPIMSPEAQGRTLQIAAVILTLAVFVAVFWWGWNMMRVWVRERYRNRPPEAETPRDTLKQTAG
jgi:glucan phosphoethanolaminetransferase (alkaline phosphatase superfamily)